MAQVRITARRQLQTLRLAGILEPDDLPHDELLRLIRPYLGTVAVVRSDWTRWNTANGRSTKRSTAGIPGSSSTCRSTVSHPIDGWRRAPTWPGDDWSG